MVGLTPSFPFVTCMESCRGKETVPPVFVRGGENCSGGGGVGKVTLRVPFSSSNPSPSARDTVFSFLCNGEVKDKTLLTFSTVIWPSVFVMRPGPKLACNLPSLRVSPGPVESLMAPNVEKVSGGETLTARVPGGDSVRPCLLLKKGGCVEDPGASYGYTGS